MIYVPGCGDKETEICIIGEAPGKDEIASKPPKPFVGAAGSMLDRILWKSKILRSNIYITNLYKYKLRNNDFSQLYEDKKQTIPTTELTNSLDLLMKELKGLKNLKVIIACGRQPSYCLTGKDGISKYRGSVLPFKCLGRLGLSNLKVIPSYHPSYINRSFFSLWKLAVYDFEKAKRIAKEGYIKKKRNLIIPYTIEEIRDFFKKAVKRDIIAIDIETIPSAHIITRISVAYSPTQAISIPLHRFEYCSPWWTFEEEKTLWLLLADLLKHPVKKLFQNGLYDVTWLEQKYGLFVNNWTDDTAIAQHIILPGLTKNIKPLSLHILTSIYTDEEFFKDEGKVIKKVNERINDTDYSIYNAKDAAVTLEVFEEQKRTKEFVSGEQVYKRTMALVTKPLRYMMGRGIKVDIKYRDKIKNELIKELDSTKAELFEITDSALNINSPKQLCNLLYNHYRLPHGVKQSSDKPTLLKLKYKIQLGKTRLPKYITNKKEEILKVIDLILKCSKLSKQIQFFEVSLDKDNRCRCSYTPTTSSGRLSSSTNPFKKGTNLQNQDRKPIVRNMFIADEGFILIRVDLAQAELRTVAYLANDIGLINDLNSGVDIFSKLASNCLGKQITKKNKKERDAFKRVVHGSNYCMGARTLSEVLLTELDMPVDISTCSKWLWGYLNTYPNILLFRQEIESKILKGLPLINPFGRIRYFYDRPTDKGTIKSAVSYLPQSTVADLLNGILTEAFKALNEPGKCEFLLQVHDEIIMQVRDGLEHMYIAALKKFFDVKIKMPSGLYMRIPEEYQVGYKWGSTKPYKE